MQLTYETVKYVSIRDPRLGILRLLLLAAIAVYVGPGWVARGGARLGGRPVLPTAAHGGRLRPGGGRRGLPERLCAPR